MSAKVSKNDNHHKFKYLSRVERLTISLVYFKKWRRIVNINILNKNEKIHFKYYFKNVHAEYYLRVVKGGKYVKTQRIILNFLISRTNENLRAILLSLKPYNLTIFVQAIRSQVELNALINKYIDDTKYHQENILLNEDRTKVKDVKTVININTLVTKLGDTVLPYKKIYDELSLLLHPNPSAIKFYAQAEGTATPNKTGVFQPKIKFLFDETITSTRAYDEWFKGYIWIFFDLIEHNLILLDSLKHDFFINSDEEEQFNIININDFFQIHLKQILKATNNAVKNKGDISETFNKEVDSILNKKQ